MTTPRMSEEDLLVGVLDLAKITGWRVAHFRPARTANGNWRTAMSGNVGFPDLVLVKGRRCLFVELKSDRGKVSDEQSAWIDALRQAGETAWTWWPSDWHSGRIREVLEEK